MDNLVSIITPCYNSELFIEETIKSVLSQSYTNFEMLIVDDCSTDRSAEIINDYLSKDLRIKYFKTDKSSGSPVLPRNIGVQNATGRYIAFLDSDDIWLPDKLKQQISLFKNSETALIFSNYEKISEDGARMNRKIIAPESATYNDLLKGNIIGCLTAVYDSEKVGKIYFKNIHQEDYILWLEILKKGFVAKNTNTVNALYRLRKSSFSSNKLATILWQWNVYTSVEETGYLKALYYLTHYSYKALMKLIK